VISKNFIEVTVPTEYIDLKPTNALKILNRMDDDKYFDI